MEQLDDGVEKLDHAFKVAEKSLGIDRLLDPEGIDLFSCTLLFDVAQSIIGFFCLFVPEVVSLLC